MVSQRRRRCSPTSRSSTGAASAAATRSRCASSSSGSSASPTTPTALLDDLDDDRVARARQDDAAQLDRALRGRRGHLPLRGAGRSTTRCSRPGPTRCSARRSSSWRPSTPTCSGSPRAPTTSRRSTSTSTARSRSRREQRGDADKPKTGVPLGRTVTNPVNGEQIPMFVADYVLMEYGTGAIMAVPAHDERDYDFAHTFGLEIRRVDRGRRGAAVARAIGPMVNSGQFDGRDNREAYDEIVRLAGPRGPRPRLGQLPPARLAALAPALLGLPDPDRLLRRVRDRPGAARRTCRSSCPTSRTTRPRAARRWPRPRTG